jgi:hypothetical protein
LREVARVQSVIDPKRLADAPVRDECQPRLQDRDYSQLAMSAGRSREEAANMSFDEIANAKLNAEH